MDPNLENTSEFPVIRNLKNYISQQHRVNAVQCNSTAFLNQSYEIFIVRLIKSWRLKQLHLNF
jgi:hypothetical protein